MINEELYSTFENYFNNEMSQVEKLELKLQLQNDADLNEKFEIYKDLNGYLENKFSTESHDFKANLEKISKQHDSQTKKVTKIIAFKTWHYAVAASLALVIGAWFMMQNAVPNYEDYTTHENAQFTERGEAIKNLILAQKAFNSKNYKAAIVNFEIVLKDYKRPEIEYFYGISLLEENRFTDAQTVFNELKIGTSVYKEKATWQLALSYLKQKNYAKCKTLIEQISADAEDYQLAQKLLNDLD